MSPPPLLLSHSYTYMHLFSVHHNHLFVIHIHMYIHIESIHTYWRSIVTTTSKKRWNYRYCSDNIHICKTHSYASHLLFVAPFFLSYIIQWWREDWRSLADNRYVCFIMSIATVSPFTFTPTYGVNCQYVWGRKEFAFFLLYNTSFVPFIHSFNLSVWYVVNQVNENKFSYVIIPIMICIFQ